MTNTASSQFKLYFVGVGPQRTGTSWVHRVFENHPELSLPIGIKETMFFDLYHAKGLRWLESHYDTARPKATTGEIGPSYFSSDIALDRLHEHNPNAKIVINIRNPVDHMLSVYRHEFSKGRVTGSFTEAVTKNPNLLKTGQYADYIPKWQARFGSQNIHLVWLDLIKSNPLDAYSGVCDFLKISSSHYPESIGQHSINSVKAPLYPMLTKAGVRAYYWLRANRMHRTTKLVKKLKLDKITFSSIKDDRIPGFSVEERATLTEFYDPDVKFLERLTGKNLSHWNATISKPSKLHPSIKSDKSNPNPMRLRETISRIST